LDATVRKRIVQRFLVEKHITLKELHKILLDRGANNEDIEKIDCNVPISGKTEIALISLYCETSWFEYKKK
jgi:hypothetical protein